MILSLYTALVPSFIQILGALEKVIDKGEQFAAERHLAPDELVQARLAEDMLPFAYQVRAAAEHSFGAIRNVRDGYVTPNLSPPPADFAGLRACVADARAGLAALTPAEVDALVGGDVCFEYGTLRLDFAAEDFLLSFSQPNFYFHATTAYDILRSKGVQLGKADFVGMPRVRA